MISECCTSSARIHEPGGQLIEQRLLLGTVKGPSQGDQPIDLVYRHQGRTPRGAHEPVELRRRPPGKESGSR